MATVVTLMDGRVIEVDGTYEDMRLYLTTGTRREVTLTDGRKMNLPVNMIGPIEQSREQRALGFR